MKKFVIGLIVLTLLFLLSIIIFLPSDFIEKMGDRALLRSRCTQSVIDRNANGLIESEEIKNAKARVLLFDVNKDGMMSQAELGGVGRYKDSIRNSKIVRIIGANGDSDFSPEELNNAKFVIPQLDLNKDGVLDRSEYQ